jgi:hypothetical protein
MLQAEVSRYMRMVREIRYEDLRQHLLVEHFNSKDIDSALLNDLTSVSTMPFASMSPALKRMAMSRETASMQRGIRTEYSVLNYDYNILVTEIHYPAATGLQPYKPSSGLLPPSRGYQGIKPSPKTEVMQTLRTYKFLA